MGKCHIYKKIVDNKRIPFGIGGRAQELVDGSGLFTADLSGRVRCVFISGRIELRSCVCVCALEVLRKNTTSVPLIFADVDSDFGTACHESVDRFSRSIISGMAASRPIILHHLRKLIKPDLDLRSSIRF
ncbi:hypothetical protein CEXT_202971 [Caerostris extrusa]|uniref:Uncharacterized protein n=1 Tax=Caerostris extrusa TaxID=172846 RepID=A0AAV4PYB6_CAEEX|nr:hypothetical protein CEXT_202971 [Caerostris extrusa]